MKNSVFNSLVVTATLTSIFSAIAPIFITQPAFADNVQTSANLSSKARFEGKVNYVVTGGTLRSGSNSSYSSAAGLNSSSTANLSGIPNGATIKKAYLYWAGSGSTIDSQVTFAGNNLTADRLYKENISSKDFFQGVKDVTNIVKEKLNGSYAFSNLSVDNGGAYYNSQTTLSGWSLVVIYEDNAITKANTIDLYEGFKGSSYSQFNYSLTDIKVSASPVAKFSALAWEGDSTLGTDGEYLKFNNNNLTDADNPDDNVFNSSINSIGKGANTTYGVDLDTFDVSSKVTAGQTSITGNVGTGQDLVLQGAAIIMVTDDLANPADTQVPD